MQQEISHNGQPISEHELLSVLESIARRLANKFRFGYHDVDDMKQQAKVFAIEGLKNYDGKRPLENFLYVHARNRLCNYKRDNYERHDRPCKESPGHNENECPTCQNWRRRNATKKNLMKPLDIGDVIMDEGELNMKTPDSALDDLIYKEILETIDKSLSIELRKDYIKMRTGIKIPKARRKLVQEAVREILSDE